MAKSQLRLLCVALFLLFSVLVPPGTAATEEKPSAPLSSLSSKTSSTNFLVDLSSQEKEWLAQHKTIRIAFDGHFPPYSFLNENDELEGLAVDMVKLLAERLGLALEVDSRLLWKDLYAAAKRREVDVVATMGDRPERQEWFLFTRPYIFKSMAIITRKETTDIIGPDDLPGRKVALVRGYQYVKPLLAKYPGIKPEFVDTMLEGFNAVAVGRADAVIAFQAAACHLMARYQITTLKLAAIYDRDQFTESLAIRKDWPALYSLLEKQLEKLSASERAAINQRWLTFGEPPGLDRKTLIRYLFLLAAGVILFAGVFIFWNRLLQRQVKLKTQQLQNQLHEQQKIEKTLKESETRFRAIFNASNDGIFIHDVETGAIIDVNPKACEMFGYSREELLRVDVGAISSGVFPYTQDEAVIWVQKAVAAGPQLFEWQGKHKSGRIFWDEVNMRKAVIGAVDRVIVSVRDISERKDVEATLLASEQRLKEAQAIAHIGYWDLDIENNRLIWSDEVYRIFDLEPQAFAATYEAFIERIHPDDREAVDRAYRNSLENRAVYEIEHRLLLPDGKIKYVNERCVTKYDEQGRPQRSIGTVQDITERKVTEAEIRRLNEELKAQLVDLTREIEHRRISENGLRIFQNMADGVTELISFVDRSYIYRAVNEAYCLYHGLEKAEIIGRTIAQLHGQNIFAELIKPVIDQALAGESSQYEAWFDFAGKGRRFVLVEYRPLLNKDKIVDGVVVAVHDLTSRKKTEDQLDQRLREMAVINKLSDHLTLDLEFKQLVEFVMNEITHHVSCDVALFYSLDDGQLFLKGIFPEKERPLGDVHQIGICLCGLAAQGEAIHSLDIHKDPRCTLNECKKAGIRSFAALPFKVGEEILGVLGVASKSIYDYGPQVDFLATFAATVAIGWQNIKLYQKVSESVKEREVQIEKLERTEKALKQARSGLEEKVKRRTADLDEARRALLNLVDDMQHANDKLQELDRLKSMFIASMSHELRTPLNSVIGFSAILKDEWLGPLNEEQKTNLETILRSGKHLLSLINDVIDISKIEAGTIEPEITEFDLDEVIQEAASPLKSEAEGKGLEFKLESFPQLILSDRRRLLQVLLNLLSNAVKFTEQGSVLLTVRFLAEPEKIEIRVTDTGIGISPEDMGKLFKPFSRLHDAGRSEYPGTGLGLYLCQKIVDEILDGTIKVESIVGRGSAFYVTIPLRVKR